MAFSFFPSPLAVTPNDGTEDLTHLKSLNTQFESLSSFIFHLEPEKRRDFGVNRPPAQQEALFHTEEADEEYFGFQIDLHLISGWFSSDLVEGTKTTRFENPPKLMFIFIK